jgi:hypothetical protein
MTSMTNRKTRFAQLNLSYALSLILSLCFLTQPFQVSTEAKANNKFDTKNFTEAELLTPQKNLHSSQCICESTATNGFVTVLIWNDKQGKHYSADQSQKDALSALLFEGFMGNGSCETVNALLPDAAAKMKFEKIATEFFKENGNYSYYVQNVQFKSAADPGKKDRWTYSMSLAKSSLSKYLLENQIIPKLNSGF